MIRKTTGIAPEMNNRLSIGIIAVVVACLASQAVAAPTILELAEQTPELSTLVAAVKAAGIEDVLNGPGPLTVFAPTNAAFGRAPMVSPRDTPFSLSLSLSLSALHLLNVWIGGGMQFSCSKT